MKTSLTVDDRWRNNSRQVWINRCSIPSEWFILDLSRHLVKVSNSKIQMKSSINTSVSGPKLALKRVILITDNDDPTGGNPTYRRTAIQRAKVTYHRHLYNYRNFNIIFSGFEKYWHWDCIVRYKWSWSWIWQDTLLPGKNLSSIVISWANRFKIGRCSIWKWSSGWRERRVESATVIKYGSYHGIIRKDFNVPDNNSIRIQITFRDCSWVNYWCSRIQHGDWTEIRCTSLFLCRPRTITRSKVDHTLEMCCKFHLFLLKN